MNNHRYITRYEGTKGARNSFCGWRLCITRQKVTYVRYFTDRECGGKQDALEAALSVRDSMLQEMEQGIAFEQIAARHRKGAV
jgi:hypothetical protein